MLAWETVRNLYIQYIKLLALALRYPELLYFIWQLLYFIPATSQIKLHTSLYKNPDSHRRHHEGCVVHKDYLLIQTL